MKEIILSHPVSLLPTTQKEANNKIKQNKENNHIQYTIDELTFISFNGVVDPP